MDKTYIIYNLVKIPYHKGANRYRYFAYSMYTFKRGGDYNFWLGYAIDYYYNLLNIPVLVKEKLTENGKIAVIMRGYRER